MNDQRERDEVEQPLIEQLVGMGWKHVTGNSTDASATGRDSFRDVLMKDELRQALCRINTDDDGNSWLDDTRVSQMVAELDKLGPQSLLETNETATTLLLNGTTVEPSKGGGGRSKSVQYIDWDNPARNSFIVIDQLRLRCPAGNTDANIYPDLVLFVNGIPLVVIEAKRPDKPVIEGIEQLRRYANQRDEVDANEGYERLFHYNQFVVATNFEHARAGTFCAPSVHFLEWKDTAPVPVHEVAEQLGKPCKTLSSQETLVAGMLCPEHLLDIVRHFTLFTSAGGANTKIVCRYQQFRAVRYAIKRLVEGKTREQDGRQDRRGGIIWHTQGSGKSLTMVFLVRAMRSHPELKSFKVVVVTDRRDLEDQLRQTAELSGDNVTKVLASGGSQAKENLSTELAKSGPSLVFTMIQKFRGELQDEAPETSDDDRRTTDGPARRLTVTREVGFNDAERVGGEYDDDESDEFGTPHEELALPPKFAALPLLNDSEKILILVDEAHRSHTSTFHAQMMTALPNCAKIGFTGTPIIMSKKQETTRIFGDFIDRYTIKQSELDGATVPILYQGMTTVSGVDDRGTLDDAFEDMFVEYSAEELEAIKQKYATSGRVLEATRLIGAKARHILRHYVSVVLPNNFKAQVVAVSRLATLRYFDSLKEAQAELVEQLTVLEADKTPSDLELDRIAESSPDQAYLWRALPYLPTIEALEFAPVFSSGHNDTLDPFGEWSAKAKIDARIERFKKPLFAEGPNSFDEAGADPFAMLIVSSMLLTGFDAPIEQALYLDRKMKEAELLQTIARVNRTYSREGKRTGIRYTKEQGMVVDYCGVTEHLTEALAAYSADDVDGVLNKLEDQLPTLRDQHQRALDVLLNNGAKGIANADVESCVEVLADEKVHAEFKVKLRQFLSTLDNIMPRPEALPYKSDAKQMAYIQGKARQRYRRDEVFIGTEVGGKVRKLIDDHVDSAGVDVRIPPIKLTADNFRDHVDGEVSPKAKASEMEHALRHHITKHLDEDPVFYESLSARLEEILQRFDEDWDEQLQRFIDLRDDAIDGRQSVDSLGLSPVYQRFFDLLKSGLPGDGEPSEAQVETMRVLTIELLEYVRGEIDTLKFWSKSAAQDALRSSTFQRLDDCGLYGYKEAKALTTRVMELTKNNHQAILDG